MIWYNNSEKVCEESFRGEVNILSAISEVLQAFISVFKSITIVDVIDMLILSYLIFKGTQIVRETRAGQLVKGIIIILICYLIASVLGLKTMTFLLETFFKWGFVALIIVFQPELRRILEKMGRTKVANLSFINSDNEEVRSVWMECIDSICDAVSNLSKTKTGALIVCERKTKLGEQVANGTILNCKPSDSIFGNIFFPNTPLHDGAVIIRDAKILAAGCFLPTPQKEELINKQLGSRHRAAIGISEISDAIVIVVSEETGNISVAEEGELTRGFSKDSLKRLLIKRFIPVISEKDKGGFAKRVKKKWKSVQKEK